MQFLWQVIRRSVLFVIGVPLVVFTAWAGGWWLVVVVGFIALTALNEFYLAAYRRGINPAAGVGYLSALALIVTTEFAPTDPYRDTILVLVLFLTAALAMMRFFGRDVDGALRDMAITLFGVIYVGLSMSFYLRLTQLDIPQLAGTEPVFLGGRVSSLLLVLAPVWATDTMAYLGGRLLGRSRLAPHLSPRKTWEGAVIGFVSGMVTAWLVGTYWNGLSWYHGVALGVIIGVCTQLGDLAESVIKRDLGIKDSGWVLGDHGGMLDRFDGVLFVMPGSYLYLWLMLVVLRVV